MTPKDVHDFVENYRFEFDGGGTYAPTDRDKAMLEDAIEGFLSNLTDDALKAEQDRRSAIIGDHS